MSDDKLKVSGVTYNTQGKDYFEKRELKRSAGIWGLWGLAVAAVISGDFSGWNFGVAAGGFGGLLIAFGILVVMYYGMMFAIGEMAAAMPHSGGAYSFARKAMGPWGGFVTGLAETIEYVATTAVIVYFSAGYADAVTTQLLNFHTNCVCKCLQSLGCTNPQKRKGRGGTCITGLRTENRGGGEAPFWK